MSSSEKRSKQTRSSSFRKDRLILFFAGCALGVACFLWVYGAKILNPLYDAWLFNTDMDLKQHYIGWCHYRTSDWHFPIGLIDTLSYPTSISVIYTDSIPIVALVFKLFRDILPQHFQYFGMFGLASFMLMGGISSLLIHALISGYAGIPVIDRKTGGLSDTETDTGTNADNTLASAPAGYNSNTSASGNSAEIDTAFPFINHNFEYIISAAASLVFIMSFTVLQRMFYHTALGAQWIIVLAIYIWVRRCYCSNAMNDEAVNCMETSDHAPALQTISERRISEGNSYSERKAACNRWAIIVYTLMGFLCVSIHTYYVPMVGSILLAASVNMCLKLSRNSIKHKKDKRGFSVSQQISERKTEEKKHIKNSAVIISEIVNLAAFCLAGILTLYIFGGFYGASSGYGEGFGSFISNLNTFINPLYGSVVLKPMKLYYDWQYEGYGYLGIGILICIIILITYNIYRMHTEKTKMTGETQIVGEAEISEGAGSAVDAKEFSETKNAEDLNRTERISKQEKAKLRQHLRSCIIRHPVRTIAVLLILLDTGLAAFPVLTFSDIKLIGIPMPEAVRRACGIFRSNGRFIWVPVYLIMTGAIVYTYRYIAPVLLKKRKGKSILLKLMLLIVLIQVLDTTKIVRDKQGYFKEDQAYTNIWSMAPFPAGDIKYNEFAFLYNENDIIMDTAFFSYLKGKRLNNYYYARNIDEEVEENIREWRKELLSGFVRNDVIYICKKDDPLVKVLTEAIRQSRETKNKSDALYGVKQYEVDDEHVVFVRR